MQCGSLHSTRPWGFLVAYGSPSNATVEYDGNNTTCMERNLNFGGSTCVLNEGFFSSSIQRTDPTESKFHCPFKVVSKPTFYNSIEAEDTYPGNMLSFQDFSHCVMTMYLLSRYFQTYRVMFVAQVRVTPSTGWTPAMPRCRTWNGGS